MHKSWMLALALCAATPAMAEGPATGPSSQGGDASEIAPQGVEKPLEADRVAPDPSEAKPPTNSDAPNQLDEPKVKAEPKADK